MKIVTIVSNNRITGVEYGVKEVADQENISLHTKEYQQIQKRKNNITHKHNIKHK